VIEISLDLHKLYFNFDFLDLHNVFFENYFVNELTRTFLKQFKTFAVRVLSDLKILGLASFISDKTVKTLLLMF
jgi:hypothetical protein